MPLLNYSTTVPAHRTVSQITEILAKAGAEQILTKYDNGRAVGVAFAIQAPHGLANYTLPVDVTAVHQVMRRDAQPRFRTPEQAERVAWRIMKDWIEAQLAIVACRMVSFDQVMLPYMATASGQTVYEVYRDQQLALAAGEF